jgi:hypothetical protein
MASDSGTQPQHQVQVVQGCEQEAFALWMWLRSFPRVATVADVDADVDAGAVSDGDGKVKVNDGNEDTQTVTLTPRRFIDSRLNEPSVVRYVLSHVLVVTRAMSRLSGIAWSCSLPMIATPFRKREAAQYPDHEFLTRFHIP